MKNLLEKFKWRILFSAVLLILVGIVLLLFPETTAKTICYLVAAIAIVMGMVTMITYFFRDVSINYYRNDFVIGLAGIILGFFIIYKVEMIISLVPFILGLVVTISGFSKIQDAIDMNRMGYSNWIGILVVAIVNVVFDIVLLLNPFEAATLMFRVMGMALIFSGMTDIVSTMYLKKKIKNYMDDMKVLEQ